MSTSSNGFEHFSIKESRFRLLRLPICHETHALVLTERVNDALNLVVGDAHFLVDLLCELDLLSTFLEQGHFLLVLTKLSLQVVNFVIPLGHLAVHLDNLVLVETVLFLDKRHVQQSLHLCGLLDDSG